MSTTTTEAVRAHYDPTGLADRVRAALAELDTGDAPLAPEQLAGLDQFHTRGLAATLELARDAGLQGGARVLDLGCGLGGPARVLAGRFGARVQGIDLSPAFVEAGRILTARCGLQEAVALDVGDATRPPFDDGAFDAAFLQHVAMNVADRPALYRQARRVLRPGGRFAIYDIVRAAGEPTYPVPWAQTAATSFLLTAPETVDAINAAGFRVRVSRDDSDAATRFFADLAAAGPPPGPTLGLVMGPAFRTLAGNLGASIADGRVGVLAAVFEAV